MGRDLPTPPDAGFINGLRFATQTFRFLDGIQSRFPDIAGIPLPARAPLVIITNPALAHDALARPDDFARVPAMGAARLIAEQGLVQSEGELWRRQRSVIGPGFAGDRVTAYADAVSRQVMSLTGRWDTAIDAATGAKSDEPNPDRGITRNLHRDMTSVTLRAASEVLFDHDIGLDTAREFHRWMRIAGNEFEFGLDVVTPSWTPDFITRDFRAAASGILELAEDLIERRRTELTQTTDSPSDMLGRLIVASRDGSETISHQQLRDEVATFLIAGHETTALSLTYTHALLAANPEVRAHVRDEARAVLGDAAPAPDHAPALDVTGRVFTETLRLYPPAWAVFRRTTTDVLLDEYRIPSGSAVVIPIRSIHRDPAYHETPNTFDPSRWEHHDPQARDAYLPFSSGPHACIGRQFSLVGAKLVIATVTRDYTIDVPARALEDLQVSATLRPSSPVDVTITPVT